MLRHVKAKSSPEKQDKDCSTFYGSIFQCLCRIVHNKEICDFVGQELDSAMKVKETLREDCIVASEVDRFELIGRLAEREPDYEAILNDLFNFFVANKESFARPDSLRTSWRNVKLSFAALETKESPAFDIVAEFQRLRGLPSRLTTDQTRELTELACSELFGFVWDDLQAGTGC